MAHVSGRALSTLIACGLVWRYAGDTTFSGRARMVLSRLLPHLGVRDALDSDVQGEGSSDSGGSSDSNGEAKKQVFENNRPTRSRRSSQWLRDYVEI